jgi:hypothetical protein
MLPSGALAVAEDEVFKKLIICRGGLLLAGL